MNSLALRRELKKHGASIDDSSGGDWKSYCLTSPAGRIWKANFSHVLFSSWQNDSESSGSIQDAIERMQLGTEACEDTECEWCHPR